VNAYELIMNRIVLRDRAS